jgi:hypothetical protein
MPLLCRTPRPQPTESLFGFVLRVSEANGYETPRHIWKIAGMPRGSECAPRFPTEPLAAVLGFERDALHPLAYRGDLESRGSFKILSHSLGDDLRSRPLRLKHPVFCPHCVSETGYLDAFWDLSAAVACPIHGSDVLTHCPACRTRIEWERPGLLTCSCGGSLLDATPPVASPLVIELMRLLLSRLRGRTGPIANARGLPLEHLTAMPFSALLRLIAVLGDIAALEKARRVRRLRVPAVQRAAVAAGTAPIKSSVPECPTARVAAAVQILSDWPNGYHEFLRTLGEHNLASAQRSVGMRKQFADFYETLFENRPVIREHAAFLRDEFIAFGLQHWGKGIVDPRMLRDKTVLKNARFVSRSELARRHRLWAPTVRRMTVSGALGGITVPVKGIERAVVDAQNTPIPAPITKILGVRQAANRLGLTVRVLKRLREQGIYKAAERRGYAHSWFADEAATFRARLVALAPVSPGRSRSDTVTLGEVMRRSTLPVETRVAVVTALLNRALKAEGRSGPSPASILLKKQDIDAIIDSHLRPLVGATCSFEECAQKIGLCRAAIAEAVRARHLVQTVVRGYKRITTASLERFQSAYLPLAAVAQEKRRSPRLLVRLIRKNRLPVIFIARANHASPQGFIPRSRLPQLMAAIAEYVADLSTRRQRGDRVAVHVDRLRAYCTQRIESGRGLPRRGGVPMKRAIAVACGFTRNLFYNQPRIQRVLDEFDRREREAHRGRCLRPEQIVADYLTDLNRSGRPLPCWHGRPNVLRIAKQCGLHRHAIERKPQIVRMLNDCARRNGVLRTVSQR